MCNVIILKSENYIDAYNIVWYTPSKDVTESMPVGGGNLQLNAWSENGDILFYIGSTDCYLDNSFTLGKLGRIRIRFNPCPFKMSFKQELKLQTSEIVFSGDNGFKFTLSTDVNNPIIYFHTQSNLPISFELFYETWNFQIENEGNKLKFYHINDWENELFHKALKEQKVEEFQNLIPDPISGLISGGLISVDKVVLGKQGNGKYFATPYKYYSLVSKAPQKTINGRITVRISQDQSLNKWFNELVNLDLYAEVHREQAQKDREIWWKEFWDRSYICIQPELKDTTSQKTEDIEAWKVGQNYQLFRYMLGCSSKGRLPVLFNGGIFNYDSPDAAPEKRNWEDCEFMAQNQRLIYWPLLKTGDYDLMLPALNMYKNMLPFQKAKAKKFWGIEGAAYPEALMIYGLHAVYADPEFVTDCFGRCADRKREEYGHSGLMHLEHHYTSMLDFAYMALNYVRYAQIDMNEFLPFIENVVKYFDNYYQEKTKQRFGEPLVNGKLVLYPASALELYAGAKNPTDVVSGLHVITDRILSYGDLSEEKRRYFEALKKRLPEMPISQKNGYNVLLPAESWELEGSQSNMEFPQMYTLFPFDYYTIESSDLDIPLNTWRYNYKDAQKNYICWFQGGIYTARLGLVDEAKSYAVRKFLHPLADGCHNDIKPNRFPVFWSNPGFCHTPDIDHGGAAMIGLQDMLMQVVGDKVYIIPAWPVDWNCNFKLHGPDGMVIKGTVKEGTVTFIDVHPISMRHKVIVKGSRDRK